MHKMSLKERIEAFRARTNPLTLVITKPDQKEDQAAANDNSIVSDGSPANPSEVETVGRIKEDASKEEHESKHPEGKDLTMRELLKIKADKADENWAAKNAALRLKGEPELGPRISKPQKPMRELLAERVSPRGARDVRKLREAAEAAEAAEEDQEDQEAQEAQEDDDEDQLESIDDGDDESQDAQASEHGSADLEAPATEVSSALTCEASETVPARCLPAVAKPKRWRNKQPFPVHALGRWAPAIRQVSLAIQVDPGLAGPTFLGMVSAVAQPLINVSFNALDNGCPLTLNQIITALSGERKSSVINTFAAPLYAVVARAEDERRNMIIQDVSLDGMVVGLINRCPAQFLLAPEGASLLGGHAMNKDNLIRFLGTVSSLYSGEALTRTRVEEHHYAPDRRMVMLVMIQPIALMPLLSSEEFMQQGLGNRILFSQPPSLVGTRTFNEVELQSDPAYLEYCQRLTELATQPWNIDPLTGGIIPRTVRMSPEAKAAWVEFYNVLEVAAGPGGDLATHAGYATRFPEQVMRIAALLAIFDNPSVEFVAQETMLRAIELGHYYLSSALDIFDAAPANKDDMDARTLLSWMRNKTAELSLPAIPVRMVYKDGPRCVRSSKRTKDLLALLELRGDVIGHTEIVVYGDGKRSADNYAVTHS